MCLKYINNERVMYPVFQTENANLPNKIMLPLEIEKGSNGKGLGSSLKNN